MTLSYYAISLETSRMVANEVDRRGGDPSRSRTLDTVGRSGGPGSGGDPSPEAVEDLLAGGCGSFIPASITATVRPRREVKAGALGRQGSETDPACSTAPWLRRRVLV